ncbi:MAG: hypothetical protein UX64_C0024G0004 [Microgenomates group bacterium GW2011_GWC2_46_7]|nr:MAG: hypothetical protein UX64_C0024G0004 [Microgenomates group bacterium GW2011_GWC2_46_7]
MIYFSREKQISALEKVAIKTTEWVGSIESIVIHSLLFIAIFALQLVGVGFEEILLLLTTAVSLEAIYLAIFIQMTVNRTTQSLANVEQDVDEIQKDVDEIQQDVDEIQQDVDEIEKDVDEIEKDVGEIEKDVDEITQGDEGETVEKKIDDVEKTLRMLIVQIENLKQNTCITEKQE